jgi:hypothetical protein
MDRRDLGIGLRRQERIEVARDLALLGFTNRCPARPDPGEAGERPVLAESEPDRIFLPPAALSSSENDVNGTTQLFAGPSQRHQCGEDVLRTFVTPGPTHHESARSPSAVGMIGAG